MEGGTLIAKNPTMPSMHQTAATQRMPPKMFKDTAVPDMRMGNLRDRGPANVLPAGIANAAQFDGKRMRKAIHRKTIDYNPTIIRYLEDRVFQRDYRDRPAIQPDSLYACQLLPPSALLDKPMNCVTTKFVRTSTNKFRCPIFCLTWTPEGRRLVTGASSGEFTLWNGLTFNFETILQAHDSSVRAMRWSHNDLWMVTADHAGYIKYWQSNMNNVKMYQGHKEAIRGISFAPTDSKFATCSDDGTVRIWDFMRCHEEKILRGHGADVKCVDWHPQKSLVASGSKDNQQPIKLWDPRTGNSLATLHAHKHTVMDLSWNQNGQWLLTASRDHLLKLFDIRNLKTELQTFKGHKKEATSIAWHPIHESLFATGGSDGSLMFWLVGCDREVGSMEEAHDGMVWSLGWHPLGHILVSGSNDHSTKFWTRNRPGDEMRDRYNLNNLPAGVEQELLEYNQEPQLMPNLPGMGLEHGLPDHLQSKEESEYEELPNIPGLDWNMDSPFFKQLDLNKLPQKKIPFAKPIPKSFEQAWLGNKPMVPVANAPKEEKKGPHMQQQQQKPSRSEGNKGSNGGIPGLPGVTPEALSILLGVNPGSIPPAALMGMLSSAGNLMQLQQSGILAIQQQALLLQQQAAMSQQALQQQQQNASGQAPQGLQQQHKPGENNPQLQSQLGQQQQQQIPGALKQPILGPMQQQGMPLRPPMPSPQQLQPPQMQLPNMQPMSMRPMINQFRPPMPGQGQQQQLPAEGIKQAGQMGSQNQFRPPGPGQFGPSCQQFKPKPQQMGGQPSPGNQSIMDQDLRRPAGPTTPSSTPQQPSSTLDMDFRRQGTPGTPEQFGSEGDLDLRHTGGRGMGAGRFPPQGRGGRGGGSSSVPNKQGAQYHDSDMRLQQQYYGGERGMSGGGGGGYADDGYGDHYMEEQYGDFDARGGGGGRDKDDRYMQGSGGSADGGYSMHSDMYGNTGYKGSYQDRQGAGPARDRNHFEEEQQVGRKRQWEEGPGLGARGRPQDPRVPGGHGGARRGMVYNGPAGPLEGRRGGRGRGGYRGGW